MSFRQSVTVLVACDGLIAPDLALAHLTGALGVPIMALFGPFQWQECVHSYPSVYDINGTARCAPCRCYKRGGHKWPTHGPCCVSGQCEALADIAPERVVSRLLKMLA